MKARERTGSRAESLGVQGLTKRFPGGTVALDDVSFKVERGEGVMVLGHNGSGKSTLLRCLVGLETPTSGEVRIGDVRVSSAGRTAGRRKLRSLWRRVGYVSQGFGLVENLSVFRAVLQGGLGRSDGPWWWFPATAPEEERDRAFACMERVGVEGFARRRVSTLSGGQQQRVAMARMLMQDPSLILADEPVASLDPRAGREVMELLWEIGRERGLTVVCILHQPELALEFGDRLLALKAGRIVLDGPASGFSAGDLNVLYEDDEVPASGALPGSGTEG